MVIGWRVEEIIFRVLVAFQQAYSRLLAMMSRWISLVPP
jgi:hypothetical protein